MILLCDSHQADKLYYSPISLVTKAFTNKLPYFLKLYQTEPRILVNEYSIPLFIASRTWVYNFIHQNGLAFPKPHY